MQLFTIVIILACNFFIFTLFFYFLGDMFKSFASFFFKFVFLMCKGFFMLYRSIRVFFCFVLPQCFVWLRIFKVFFCVSFTHLLHLFGWNYFWLFFFCCFNTIHCHGFFCIMASSILFCNYFHITKFLINNQLYLILQLLLYHKLLCLWLVLSCFATTFIS